MQLSRETTLLLADDQAVVREGFAALFAAKGMRVVGECSDGATACEMIDALQPDFAILDVYMPVMTGIDVTRRLRSSGCAAKLVILSVDGDENCVMAALRAGADAYLLKDGPFRHVMDALSFVQDGGVYISPLLGGASWFTKKDRAEDPLSALSPREKEVLFYLLDGLRAKGTADRLAISPKTVDTYRASLMRKLNVRDVVELVTLAIKRGWKK